MNPEDGFVKKEEKDDSVWWYHADGRVWKMKVELPVEGEPVVYTPLQECIDCDLMDSCELQHKGCGHQWQRVDWKRFRREERREQWRREKREHRNE